MFDHIGFGVSDMNKSREFFLQALGPLGVRLAMEGPDSVGLGKKRQAFSLAVRRLFGAGPFAYRHCGDDTAGSGRLPSGRPGCGRPG